ncbi:hypothetical protein LINPERHAP1_LOCUS1369, partial [Linum perenne]
SPAVRPSDLIPINRAFLFFCLHVAFPAAGGLVVRGGVEWGCRRRFRADVAVPSSQGVRSRGMFLHFSCFGESLRFLFSLH